VLLERPEVAERVVELLPEGDVVVTRVRPVVAGVEVVAEDERRLLVVPSVYRGEDEVPRPELTEEELDEDVLLPETVLLLKDEERPEDE
jgi:hypothetical protein